MATQTQQVADQFIAGLHDPLVIKAEARVWANYMKPLEDLIGDRLVVDVISDDRVLEALDEIDWTALREFLEIIGDPQEKPQHKELK